jgi:hypothetical protein
VDVAKDRDLHSTLPASIAQAVKDSESPGSKEQQRWNTNDQ